MKDKVPKIEGRKVDKYSFEHEKKEYKYEIQEPVFDQITAALGQTKPNGNPDVIGAGKVIWELCCVSFDPEIETNPKLLVRVCIALYQDYVDLVDIEIKKK